VNCEFCWLLPTNEERLSKGTRPVGPAKHGTAKASDNKYETIVLTAWPAQRLKVVFPCVKEVAVA
jgi:hypothetical protein